MRELNSLELQQVSGGALSMKEGAALIIGISSFSPVTAAFGYPIGFAMLYVDYRLH